MSIHRRVSTAAATRRRPSKFTPGPPLSRPSSSSSHISFLPSSFSLRHRCRLSGFSAPLTTLSRKYVNVHACPIIRSSRSLFSLVRSFGRDLPIDFSPLSTRVPLCALWNRDRSILARESRIHVVPRFKSLPCLGNEKTIDSTMLRPRGRSKRKVRRENTRRDNERGSRIVPPYSIKGEFTRVRS